MEYQLSETLNNFQESRLAIPIFWPSSTKQIFFIFFVIVLFIILLLVFVFKKKQLVSATKEPLLSLVKGRDPGSAKQGAKAWSNQWKRGEEGSIKPKTIFKRAWRSSERRRWGGGGRVRLSRRRRERGRGGDSVADGSAKKTQTNRLPHRRKHWAVRQPKKLQVRTPNRFFFQETLTLVMRKRVIMEMVKACLTKLGESRFPTQTAFQRLPGTDVCKLLTCAE